MEGLGLELHWETGLRLWEAVVGDPLGLVDLAAEVQVLEKGRTWLESSSRVADQ